MPKTIRVRIAVAMNAKGEWCAAGSETTCDDQASRTARGGWGPNVVHFVEADVPVPEATITVEGQVTD
jgi:transglutaminase-like putative cysteine protease